jgi:hypothetical protein
MNIESVLAKLDEIAAAVQNNHADLINRIETLEVKFMEKIKIIEDNYSEDKNAAVIVAEKLDQLLDDVGALNRQANNNAEICDKLRTSAVALENDCTALKLHLQIIDKIKADAGKNKQILEEALSNPNILGNVNKSGEVTTMSKEEYFIFCWANNLDVEGKLDGKPTIMNFRKLAPANADALKGKLTDEKKIAKLFYKHITELKNNGDLRSTKALEFFNSVYGTYSN